MTADADRSTNRGPSVGNILGLSLLLRDRGALLTMQDRLVAPGVTVEFYEGRVPGVRLPLRGSLSPGRFRHRRCATERLGLRVENWALDEALRRHLTGRTVGPLRIQGAALLPPPAGETTPWLALWGTALDRARPAFALMALGLRPAGAHLGLHVADQATLGLRELRLADLLEGLPGVELTPDGPRIPAARAVLGPACAAAGWRPPANHTLAIHAIRHEDGAWHLELDARPAEPGALASPGEPTRKIAKQLRRVVDDLARGRRAQAVERMDRALRTAGLPRPVAAGAWAFLARSLAGPGGGDAPALTACARWLAEAPDDPTARRLHALARIRAGAHEALEQDLARIDLERGGHARLARGLLLAGPLEQPGPAAELLAAWVTHWERAAAAADDPHPDLGAALAALARARAQSAPQTPHLALGPLEHALRLEPDPRRAAALLMEVAEALASPADGAAPVPATRELAQELALRASDLLPLDDDLVTRALALAERVGDGATTVALLERRLHGATGDEALALRKRIIHLLSQDASPTAPRELAEHLEHALRADPEDVDLLTRALDLALTQEDTGRVETVAAALDAVLPHAEVAARVALAHRLLAAGHADPAWPLLRVALEAGDGAGGEASPSASLAGALTDATTRLALARAEPVPDVVLDRAWARGIDVDRALPLLLDRARARGQPGEAADYLLTHLGREPSPPDAATWATELARLARAEADALRAADLGDAVVRALLGVPRPKGDVEGRELLAQAAGAFEALGRPAEAAEALAELLARIPTEDAAAVEPALELAERWLDGDTPGRAAAPLERARRLAPQDPRVLELACRLAARQGDAAQHARALAAWVEHAPRGEREPAARELLRVLDGNPLTDRLDLLARATRALPADGPAARELATAWWSALHGAHPDPTGAPPDELRPRLEALDRISAAPGAPTRPSAPHLRDRVATLAALGEHERALQAACEGLSLGEGSERWLVAIRDLLGEHPPASAAALGRVAEALPNAPPGPARDEAAVALAEASMALADPRLVLRALAVASGPARDDDTLAELWVWATTELDGPDGARARLDQELTAAEPAPWALRALLRLWDDPAACTQRLLELAREHPDSAPHLLPHALAAALAPGLGPRLLVQAATVAARCGCPDALAARWQELRPRVADAGDPSLQADLVLEALRAAGGPDHPLWDAAMELADASLAAAPGAPYLHRALWSGLARIEPDPAARSERIVAHLEDLLARGAMDARAHAEAIAAHAALVGAPALPLDTPAGAEDLQVGDGLGRRAASRILSRRAEALLANDEAFSTLLSALEDGQHWPDVLRLLDLRARDASLPVPSRVESLRHLAHICGEVLDDPDSAMMHLEAALELSPEDPDLLLYLLDLYYARANLPQAVSLTRRVLTHVPMGDVAYAALAHRAADAATAAGDLDTAREILGGVLARTPEDEKTRARLDEIAALAGEAEPRVRLLAAIASRQGGRARVEALEERANLLVDPLGRVEEAIEDLSQVVAAAPDREPSVKLLCDLLEREGRWSELVALLEAQFPRLRGQDRGAALARIGRTYRHHLLDLPRAEQALRLALDDVSPDAAQLGTELRLELVEVLEQQGRYVDLVAYLERELAPELQGEVGRAQATSERAALLGHLARVLQTTLEDEERAVRVYERMEYLGRLPDEGLSCLARWYRRHQRHEDLLRILTLRAHALNESGDTERVAELEQHMAELLEGPLGRPQEAAYHWLTAYLSDPSTHEMAGAKARLLLSGTASVAQVRARLSELRTQAPAEQLAALDTLLGDVLAPHEEHEGEAERAYGRAIAADPEFAPAHDGLGRLLARQGRLDDAADALTRACASEALPPKRASETATIAARALFELGRMDAAEQILQRALARGGDAQRVLLELARLYARTEQPERERETLHRLSELPLSAMLRAEVSYRRAMLMLAAAPGDPLAAAMEPIRAMLLDAVQADAKHVAAREALLDLATRRGEWSTVAHMHFLAIRDQPPGPARAHMHLELARVYAEHLHDVDSALRNLESAVVQAPDDAMMIDLAGRLAEKLPEPAQVAARFESLAAGVNDLSESVRARLWLLAADLHMRTDDLVGAETASNQVLQLSGAPGDATNAATRRLESLRHAQARDLRMQRTALLRLLDAEEHPAERLHILGRLRELGRALGDDDLVERVSLEQIELAHGLEDTADRDAAVAALREVFSERGDHDRVVELYEHLATGSRDPGKAAALLADAARFAWHYVKDGAAAGALLRRGLSRAPGHGALLDTLGELATTPDANLARAVLAQLGDLPDQGLAPPHRLHLARLHAVAGDPDTALREIDAGLDGNPEPAVRLALLRARADRLAESDRPAQERADLAEAFALARAQVPAEIAPCALRLAQALRAAGNLPEAAAVCDEALGHAPRDVPLLRLRAELSEERESWPTLARELGRLADLDTTSEARARWLTRLARLHLDHPELSPTPRRAMATAYDTLLRARDLAPELLSVHQALLPLAFGRREWDQVLECAQALRDGDGERPEVLILAALTAALRDGDTGLARTIGARHDPAVFDRMLWPGLRHVLAEIAAEGPLPRLDPVLAAGAALCGSGSRLLRELADWGRRHALHPGVCLGLARLHEARGNAERARHMYQLAAFMAPGGPVPRLVRRLPAPTVPRSVLEESWSSLETRGALRGTLQRVRPALSGLRLPGVTPRRPAHRGERALVALAGDLVGPWRTALGLSLPLVICDALECPVAPLNLTTPSIALHPGAATLDPARFHAALARAAAALAMGLAPIRDPAGGKLVDLLDALGWLVNPAHEPSGPFAAALIDALAASHAADALEPELRLALADELLHWLSATGAIARLGHLLGAAENLLATRLCGRLDGVFLTLAADLDDAVPATYEQALELLELQPCRDLLRALDLR